MLKKMLVLTLVILMIATSAYAEIGNRDLQMIGSIAAVSSQDTYFFCPMEEGVTGHWGLYALSSCQNGPIIEISNGYPARLLYANKSSVYFLAYSDSARSVHELYRVTISDGSAKKLLSDIKTCFVSEGNSFYYTTTEAPCYLMEYDMANEEIKKVKDMSSSNKAIYDAAEFDGKTYFLTQTDTGVENGYLLNNNGKANNLDSPTPKLATGMLYEGYRVYSTSSVGNNVYSVKIGQKKATQLGKDYGITLSTPRFGNAFYGYDGNSNSIVRIPLDGSDETKLGLDGETVTRFVVGGYADELLMFNNDGIYAVKGDLSSKERLFDFDILTANQIWCNACQSHDDSAVLLFGYGQRTYTYSANMMPTAVYVFDRNTGEQIFGYPEFEESLTLEELLEEGGGTFGGMETTDEAEEEETYFVF